MMSALFCFQEHFTMRNLLVGDVSIALYLFSLRKIHFRGGSV